LLALGNPSRFNQGGNRSITAVAVIVILSLILVLTIGRFDPTQGPLTISIFVVVAFIGAMVTALLFNIPHDEETATLVGGLGTGFGSVITYWLIRGNGGGPPH
jgi:hypothetical protein